MATVFEPKAAARWPALFVCILSVAACPGKPTSDAGADCASTCGAGHVCAANVCLPKDCSNARCGDAEACVERRCVPLSCVGIVCGGDDVCISGACRSHQCGSASCASNEGCVDGTCVDARCYGVICQPGAVCANGACYPLACSGVVCPTGSLCSDGACVDPACAGVTCSAGTSCTSDAGSADCTALDGGGTGGGAGGGAGGGSGGGQGCNLGGVLSPDDFCAVASRGVVESYYQEAVACGQPLTRADFARAEINPNGLAVAVSFLILEAQCDGGMGVYAANVADSIHAGRLCYDGLRLDECRALIDGGVLDAGALVSDGGSCKSIFIPNVGLGGNCLHDFECVEGAYCEQGGITTCQGVCQLLKALGETCDLSRPCGVGLKCVAVDAGVSSCASDAVIPRDAGQTDAGQTDGGQPDGGARPCSPTGDDCGACGVCLSSGVCAVGKRFGQTCSAIAPCVDYLRCDGVTGTCLLRPREGETCRVTAASGSSQRGDCLYADTFCARSLPGVLIGTCAGSPLPGQNCGNTPDRTPHCANLYNICKVPSGQVVGVCADRAPTGQSCSQNMECLGGVCDGGACIDPPLANQPCAPGGVCGYHEWCSGAVCLAKHAAGTACSQSLECIDSSCDHGLCVTVCHSNGAADPSAGCYGCRDGLSSFTGALLFSMVLQRRRRPALRR